ncbi:MAG: zf-HC2 domain-containing protein [Acidimicrobiales bacterium]|nr:zf-HC2 domain-containing protein [Acidimicrobiales bacterium]
MIRRSFFRRNKPEVDCHEVGRVLQSYLDGDVEDDFAAKISAHLEACRDCGLEVETYRQIKTALASRLPEVDPAVIDRLRRFGNDLTTGD